jgi:hypothetical protein
LSSTLSTGTATRVAAGQSGTQVANVGDVFMLGGTSHARGSTAKLFARFEDRDSKSTVNFYLDTDQDPYDGGAKWLAGSTLPKATTAKAARLSATISAAAGTYFLYAKITDASGFTRYAYEQNAITITPVTPAARTNLVANAADSGQTKSVTASLIDFVDPSVLT